MSSTFAGSQDYVTIFQQSMRDVNSKFGDTEDAQGNFVPASSNPGLLEGGLPASAYANAFSPDGSHTSTNSSFEDTQSANVKKLDPNYSVANGYALPVASPSVMPKILILGAAGFGVYWFFFRKKAV
jgi:hypothetical protein